MENEQQGAGMDLVSGQPFWPLYAGAISSYPRLERSLVADVAIIGAGITGALIADELTQAGASVVVLDRREVARGSTAASTALLQYEMDTSLSQLADWCGPDNAAALYRFGLQGLNRLQQIGDELPDSGGFQSRSSLYFASSDADLPALQGEYQMRLSVDLPVEYWAASAIHSVFDFNASGALYSRSGGEIDPFRMTHALLNRVQMGGGYVFARSEVRELTATESGVRLRTEDGSVAARFVVIAAGYESETFLPEPVASLRSTFAFATKPLADFPGWPERCLIWETARPYLYLRTTADGRLLAGGEDTWFRNAGVRDRLLPSRIARIEARVRKMFPRIRFEVAHAWAGTFAETLDGLPFIGPHHDRPSQWFALCYGGNGITFGVLASVILRAQFQDRTHPLAAAVAFDRSSLGRATAERGVTMHHPLRTRAASDARDRRTPSTS
jgi:glycine/D-amino acid oxidase-like deaminating enzyme